MTNPMSQILLKVSPSVMPNHLMTDMIDLVRKGHFKKGENVVFLHTGGAAALFAYQSVFASSEGE